MVQLRVPVSGVAHGCLDVRLEDCYSYLLPNDGSLVLKTRAGAHFGDADALVGSHITSYGYGVAAPWIGHTDCLGNDRDDRRMAEHVIAMARQYGNADIPSAAYMLSDGRFRCLEVFGPDAEDHPIIQMLHVKCTEQYCRALAYRRRAWARELHFAPHFPRIVRRDVLRVSTHRITEECIQRLAHVVQHFRGRHNPLVRFIEVSHGHRRHIEHLMNRNGLGYLLAG